MIKTVIALTGLIAIFGATCSIGAEAQERTQESISCVATERYQCAPMEGCKTVPASRNWATFDLQKGIYARCDNTAGLKATDEGPQPAPACDGIDVDFFARGGWVNVQTEDHALVARHSSDLAHFQEIQTMAETTYVSFGACTPTPNTKDD